MVRKDIVKSQLLYFIAVVFFIYVIICAQATFLALLSSSWFHIDLISIVLVYLCFEHHLLFTAFHAVIAGALLQIFSTSPQVFFILYFMILVVLSEIFARYFVINSLFAKVALFILLYFLKYILFYFSLTNKYEIGFLTLISVYWKEFFITCLASVIIYPLLLKFDSLFILSSSIKSGKSYG